MITFNGKIVFLGCGSIAQCVLTMLPSFIEIPFDQITVIDFVDNREKISPFLAKGISYIFAKVSPLNFDKILGMYLSEGDLLIDLAWNIDTGAIIQWCHLHEVLYINTSVEVWNPYEGLREKPPRELTLYHRQLNLRNIINSWQNKSKSVTAIVDHGANPGLVSHFTKYGMIEIALAILKQIADERRIQQIERALADQNFADLAFLIGLKTIHISERDTQITNKPKRVNEFVNTWSIEGLIEEGIAPAEIGWGTHETFIPKGAMFHLFGPGNQICLAQKGLNTWVKSYVPSGPIKGMVIRHGEAFSISEALTLWNDNIPVYRPTVHYAYCPCDAAINSLHELEMRHYNPQSEHRILSQEIIEGKDELGCLLMGHDLGCWWTGSVLDILEARQFAPRQNATSVQVAAGVLSAAVYALKHPHLGFCLPDQIDYKEILDLARPYLGTFISKRMSWSPMDNAEAFMDYGSSINFDPEDRWQYIAFSLAPSPSEFISMHLPNVTQKLAF